MVERSHTAGFLPQLFDPIRSAGQKVADWFAPRSDAAVATDHYEITMELPGVAAKDIDITVHEDTLTIRGEKHLEHVESDKSYFFSEREFGAFQRAFRMPVDADPDTIDAAFRDGVLTVRFSKHPPHATSGRKVEIRAE